VTFVVEGELRDGNLGMFRTGDVQWMTAGSGVIHNEETVPVGKTRILQLWLRLPLHARWAAPRFEHVTRESAPVRRERGAEARVYSGSSGSARATIHNNVPVTLVDLRLQPGATFEQELLDSYNGFLYVLEGAVSVGAERTRLTAGQVGWLAETAPHASTVTAVHLVAGDDGERLLLYAGERQSDPILLHGPFVGESRAAIMRLSKAYMNGEMPRISDIARNPDRQPVIAGSPDE
jgi:redox-sensitive bicupin YhaK (pirin superfamily)